MTYGSWKSIRLYLCKSSMSLWTALNLVNIKVIERRPYTRQELKDAILSFPKNTDGCRCKECRYFRLVKGLNK